METLESRTLLSVAPLNIALVSDAVAQAQEVRAAAAKDTIAIVYQSDKMTTTGLVDLLASVSAAHNGLPIGNLAIVAHGNSGELDLGKADDLNLATLPGQTTALERLRSVLANNACLDLYSCDVAAGASGKAFVNDLAAVTGATVYASDNLVGTVPGANLILDCHSGQAAASNDLFSVQDVETIRGLCLTNVTLTLYVHQDSTTGPVLANVLVVGHDGAGASFSQMTNASGLVTLTGASGTWNFTASRTYYQAASWSSAVSVTQTNTAFLLGQSPLSAAQVAAYGYQAGFRGGNLVDAVAVADAEAAGFYVGATNVNTLTSVDRGLWQINSVHSEYNAQQLLSDASYNATAAYNIFTVASGWTPWSAFNNDSFASYLQTARTAVQGIDSTVVRGANDRVTVTANGVNVRLTAGGATTRAQVNAGATGTVLGGPVVATVGTGTYRYIWWDIHWDDGLGDGWVAEDYLSRTGTATAAAPIVQTTAASSIAANSAVVNGTVNPNGASTSAYFQYGTTTSYGTTGQTVTGITATQNLQTTLTGLAPSTTYHYRIVASNSSGTTYGSDMSFTTVTVQAAPANNSFVNRTLINGTSATMTGTNVGATKETGEPNHAGNSGGKSVWWTWTAPSSGSVQIDTIGSNFDTIMGVYTGSSVSSLTTIASDDDSGGNYTSKVTFNAVSGTTYQIAVDGYNAASGNITLHVNLTTVTAPVNDNFANRTLISGTSATMTGTNVGATKESGEPNPVGNSGGKSVWWTWTAPSSGSVQIDTIGSSFDTILGVYTGSTASSLTTIASDDDSGGNYTSKVTFNAVGGTTYQIAVDGYNYGSGAASGNITLHVNLTLVATPVLNVSTTSLTLPATIQGTVGGTASFTVGGSGLGSNDTLNLMAPAGSEISQSGTSGFVNTFLLYPNNSGNLATTTVYVRTSASAAANVSGNLTISDALHSSLNKSILVSGTVTPLAAPVNNNFANRTSISGTSATVTGTNVGATKESGEPNPVGNSGGKSVWWTWTAPSSGSVQIDTIGSSFDTILGVYTGSSVSSLTTIASDDDSGGNLTSKVTFNAVAGTSYQIAVDGYSYGSSAASGNITLHVYEDMQQWIPVNAPLQNAVGNRSTANYDAVINQFAVETNPRYTPSSAATYCNIFAWDVTSAMGAPIPHWYNATTGAPTAVNGGSEMSAASMLTWLQSFGSTYGWYQLSTEQAAQASANAGQPTIVIGTQGGDGRNYGHVAVVRPGQIAQITYAGQTFDLGPSAAQAGLTNFNQAHVYYVVGVTPQTGGFFGGSDAGCVEYWYHA